MKLKCKRLQKNMYIFFESKGRRTYLVHNKKRMKEIKYLYKKYKIAPWKK